MKHGYLLNRKIVGFSVAGRVLVAKIIIKVDGIWQNTRFSEFVELRLRLIHQNDRNDELSLSVGTKILWAHGSGINCTN